MTRIEKVVEVALALRLEPQYIHMSTFDLAGVAQSLVNACEIHQAAQFRKDGRPDLMVGANGWEKSKQEDVR